MSASLFDSNVWVALTFARHPFHQKARSALQEQSASSPAVFCRSTEQSFLRLASTPSLLAQYQTAGLNNGDIVEFLLELHRRERVVFAKEPKSTRELWLKLASSRFASPKLWMDAYLAAFAISGRLRFVTFDKDFRQFQAAGLDLHLLKSKV